MKTKICPECGAVNTIDRDVCFKCEEVLVVNQVFVEKKTGISSGSIIQTLLILMLIGVVVSIFMPNFHNGRNRKRARQKACIANIKMLENALEMYDMDTPPENPGVTTVVCTNGVPEPVTKYGEILQTGGYVQRLPKCPTTNSFNAYSVHREGPSVGYAMYVECKVHGTISAQKGL